MARDFFFPNLNHGMSTLVVRMYSRYLSARDASQFFSIRCSVMTVTVASTTELNAVPAIIHHSPRPTAKPANDHHHSCSPK